MRDGHERTRRRAALAGIVGLVLLLQPGPRATVELTARSVTLAVETGPLRLRTLAFDGAQAARPVRLILSIAR